MEIYRPTVLELPERVGLTKEAKKQLRELRRMLKKSMAQIVCELIDEKYKSLNKK